MRCDEFQEQLNVVLDERRSPLSDEGLVRHAETCMSCDASLAMSVQLVGAFAAEFSAAVDDAKTVDRKTVDRVAQASRSTTSASKLTRSLFVAAAMVAIAFSVGQYRSSVGNNKIADLPTVPDAPAVVNVVSVPAPPIVEETATLKMVVVPNVDQIPVPPSSAFVHQPILSLGLLSTAEWDYSVNEVNMPFGARLPVEPRWIEVVSDGIVPVQQSMTKTLAAIRKSLSS